MTTATVVTGDVHTQAMRALSATDRRRLIREVARLQQERRLLDHRLRAAIDEAFPVGSHTAHYKNSRFGIPCTVIAPANGELEIKVRSDVSGSEHWVSMNHLDGLLR